MVPQSRAGRHDAQQPDSGWISTTWSTGHGIVFRLRKEEMLTQAATGTRLEGREADAEGQGGVVPLTRGPQTSQALREGRRRVLGLGEASACLTGTACQPGR